MKTNSCFFLAVLVAGCVSVCLPLSSAAEVVLNGGFETLDSGFPGGIQNWYASTGGTGSTSGYSTASAMVHTGNNGWLLEPHTPGNNDVGTASVGADHWVITGGAEYDLSFSLRFLGGTASGIWGSYTVGYYDNAHTYLSDSGAQYFPYPGEWTELSQSFTAPANAGYINVTFYGFAQDNSGTGDKYGQWALDDVSMNPAAIPEPGTLALLLGGFGLLAGARRFRKRS